MKNTLKNVSEDLVNSYIYIACHNIINMVQDPYEKNNDSEWQSYAEQEEPSFDRKVATRHPKISDEKESH